MPPTSAVPDGAFALSAAQRSIWFAQQIVGAAPISIALYVRVTERMDAVALTDALVRAGREFGSGCLRLIGTDGVPLQVIDERLDNTPMFLDLRDTPDPEAAAHAWMGAEYTAPHDLLRDRLTMSAILRLGNDHYIWYSRVHHIALDGFGMMTVAKRVAELYTAAVNGGAASMNRAANLRSIVDSELDYIQSTRFEVDRRYWMQRLPLLPEVVGLAGRPARAHAHPRLASARLSSAAATKLATMAKATHAPPASVLVAAFGAFISSMTGAPELTLSLPVTARATAALRCSGGMLANVLPLPVRVSPMMTTGELVQSMRRQLAEALLHQRYRREDMLRDMNIRGGPGSFGPQVNVLPGEMTVDVAGTVGRVHVLTSGLVDDLAVVFYPGTRGDGTLIDFQANPRLYPDRENRAHLRRFLGYLDRFLGTPDLPVSHIGVLDNTDRALVASVAQKAAEPGELPQLLAAAAGRPNAPAVISDEQTMSYHELDEVSNRLARVLIRAGAGPEDAVAVLIPRSARSVIALWAVAKAGAVFVPIDPMYPAERIAHMVADSAAVTGLTVATLRSMAPDTLPWIVVDDPSVLDMRKISGEPVSDGDRIAPLRPENPAYMLYTSGSTGRPKAVVMPHAGLPNLAKVLRERFSITSQSRVLHVSSPSFDASIGEIVMAAGAGAALIVSPPLVFGGVELADLIRRQRVTHVLFTPAALASMDPAGLDDLGTIVVGGEDCSPDLVTEWATTATGRHRAFCNCYGPTETMVCTNLSDPLTPGSAITIGGPISGVQCLVLDAGLRPVPRYVVGELYLTGVQLGRCYRGCPAMTAVRYVACPLGEPGARMYRTGDLAKWNAEGHLIYSGRTDFQVKIRGCRVEPGEVQVVLAAHPAIRQAVVIARESPGVGTDTAPAERAHRQLVAYVVLNAGAAADRASTASELRRYIEGRLPSYLVPAAIVVLDRLPISVNGKVDRGALPAPEFTGDRLRLPRSNTEQVLAATVADVLGLDEVGIDDNFFELGGTSLSAMKVAANASSALAVHLTVRDVFEARTTAQLSVRVDSIRGDHATRPPAQQLRMTSVPRPDLVPLSAAQHALWQRNRLDSITGTAQVAFALRLSGTLNIVALRRALHDVVRRHETLRTVYPDGESGPHQVIVDADRVTVELPMNSCTESEVEERLVDFASVRIDIEHDFPFRGILLDTGLERFVLAVVIHHIATDGWSMGLLARETAQAYTARCTGNEPNWEPLPVQYADYALWQQRLLGDAGKADSVARRQLDYWTQLLSSSNEYIELPVDRRRPLHPTQIGASIIFWIDPSKHSGLESLAHAHNCTFFTVMHAAFAALLNRLGAGGQVSIGTEFAGRGPRELDDVVGMFANTLVLRTAVDPAESFTHLLGSCRDIALDAFGNADLPFEYLEQVLHPAPSRARHSLFQVKLLMPENVATIDLPGISAQVGGINTGPWKVDDLDLMLYRVGAGEAANGIAAQLHYSTELFDEKTVRIFAAAFMRILETILREPDSPIGEIEISDVRGIGDPVGAPTAAAARLPGHTPAYRSPGDG